MSEYELNIMLAMCRDYLSKYQAVKKHTDMERLAYDIIKNITEEIGSYIDIGSWSEGK